MLYYVATVVIGIDPKCSPKRPLGNVGICPLAVVHVVLLMPIALAIYIVCQVFAYVLSIPFYFIAGGFWFWHKVRGTPDRRI